jgi:hypothetical protein
MRVQLHQVVRDVHWRKAAAYLKLYWKEKVRPLETHAAVSNGEPHAGSWSRRPQIRRQPFSREVQRSRPPDAHTVETSWMKRLEGSSKIQQQSVALSTTWKINFAPVKPSNIGFPALERNECPPDGISFPVAGWSQRNVISSRVAWARLRLARNEVTSLRDTPDANTTADSAIGSEPVPTWYNEKNAEEDSTLAVLSEGAEIYLKSVLQKVLHCARQRQNLEGTRLWYPQDTGASKPALVIRLGCDVERSLAQVAGDAGMTCPRMEWRWRATDGRAATTSASLMF